ncbi:MAG TPA: hypothetical protein VGN57_23150 [Pirellulaceae bacterium]|jgi:hypothetical protein|nr:hypothetical protein [Pirellulaceae bacterium]
MIRAQELEQEIRRTTEEMRAAFAVSEVYDEAAAEALHERFVECVKAVNSRLKKCDELLRKGLRSEAVQECETAPNLFDLVNEIDVPEWSAWAQYVGELGLPPQPPLLLGVAEELNAAYEKSRSLEQLLRKQRLHALARSPLSVRLSVLRSIADRDPDNPIWREDQANYETARMRQLDAELTTQLLAKDMQGVASLRAELDSPEWIAKPPKPLLDRAHGAHRTLLFQEARRQLERLVAPIDAAHSEQSVDALAALRQKWNRLATTANLHSEDELAVATSHAFEWLDDELGDRERLESFQRALAALEAALDSESAGVVDLEALYVAATRFDEEIPLLVEQRYRNRIDVIHLAGRRRSILILATSLSVLLLVSAALGFFAYHRMRVQEIADFRDNLAGYRDKRLLKEGIAAYEAEAKARPHVTEDPGVNAIVGEMREEVKKDGDRAFRVQEHLTAAAKSLEEPGWDDVAAAARELNRAEEIAVDAEQTDIARVKRDLERARNSLQQSVDDEFRNELRSVEDQMARLAALEPDAIAVLESAIEALEETPRVSPPTMAAAQLQLMRQKIAGRLKTIGEQQALDRALAQVVRAIGQPKQFETALTAYRDRDRTTPRAADFGRVIGSDLTNVVTVDKWNAAARGWNAVSVRSISDPAPALAAAKVLTENFAAYPGVAAISERQKYLSTFAAREEARSARDAILDIPAMGLGVFHVAGVRYYCPIQEMPHRVLVGLQGWQVDTYPSSLELTKTVVKPFAADQVPPGGPQVEPSPQAKFTEAARAMLKRNAYTYEGECCKLLDMLVVDPQIDPIFKALVLEALIDELSKGSPLLQKGLTPLAATNAAAIQDVKRTLSQDVASLNWFADDSNREVNTAREKFRIMFSRLDDELPSKIYRHVIDPAYGKVVADLPPLPTYRWIATLLKDADGNWTCRAPATVKLSGALFVYDPSQGAENPFVPVGTLDDGTMTLTEGSSLYLEGRTVYLQEGAPHLTSLN